MEQQTPVIFAEQLLVHWQGHRSLTRRIIEAFPEEQLLNYSIGGMRPFAAMAIELIRLASLGITGMHTGVWDAYDSPHIEKDAPVPSKEVILQLWDALTEKINTIWPQIRPERFREIDKAFGMYEGAVSDLMLYWVDNENHHRGQAYVYLRSLGIEPPPFWDR
ncbi:damage-inducible protein DinB [Chitinophaga sp. SYP-B3965]|uniref:DinB family protein n=1 Tax=Chitinophaga sp. SYP-B3965 TaxID=2663120 RepID=UPI001299F306|nr:DinB family protein [Chitinophaga sp. SYP-B3965]MRG43827.1 damage-inducible protein DinB [Chitinophaga sp. SYP-B3965]